MTSLAEYEYLELGIVRIWKDAAELHKWQCAASVHV